MSPQGGRTQLGKEELKITPITPEAKASTSTANNTIDNSTAGGGAEEVAQEDSTVKVRKVTISETAILTLGEELEKALSPLALQDDPLDKEVDRPSKLLKAYLLKNEKEFVRVMEFRDRGWNINREKGDTFFKEQRERADNADHKGEHKFFVMMKQIAFEMNLYTGALSPPVVDERVIKVLDICMAPGGYSAAILKLHSTAKIFGITLHKEEGGHPLMLSFHQMHGCKFMDVTMLVSEFTKDTDRTISKTHPDYDKFDGSRPFVSHKMDIVLCDGMVLRTQERASYRQQNEAIRLSTAQLILGMQRIIQGGTLIMLLHKIDSWAAASILYSFSKFSKVQVFKPVKKHNTRSSFYMVAKAVNVESPAASTAVAEWKTQWYEATFGAEVGTGGKISGPDEKFVLQAIQEFGPTLIKLGFPVWRIQADALSRTEYAGDLVGAAVSGKENIALQKPLSPKKDA